MFKSGTIFWHRFIDLLIKIYNKIVGQRVYCFTGDIDKK